MDKLETLQLPEEGEYPEALTERFELLERMSGSGDTETLLARDRRTGERVTVKCFLREHPLYDRREPEALRRLQAPQLPAFIGEYCGETMRCVVRQYAEGESLAERAARAPLTEAEIRELGIRLCGQLETLHSARPPVIHRDVKPQNIILGEDGSPVLIDFGIAREYSEKDADTLIMGTQGFAPPEQYGFQQTDARSDLYSLGQVMRWLLERTGKDASPPLDRALRRMTAFDPERRYQTARQAQKALEAARPESRRRRGIWGALIGMLLLAFLSILGTAGVRGLRQQAVFAEPLVEEAARMSLGLGEGDFFSREMLAEVRGIYILAGEAFPDAESFYAAVNRWYAEERPGRGTMTDLADLAQMPGLEEVCVAAQQLEDLSALEGLTHMIMAEFKHNEIRDISVLGGKKKLTLVGLNDNPVRDLSPLADCPALAFLDLCDVRNYDPRILERLGNFDYLDLSNPTESWRYLGRRSVISLALRWTGITDLEELAGVTRLETLDISHTAVTDLGPLAVHSGLRHLKMPATPVKDLRPLLEMPLLESVTLSREMEKAAEELEGRRFEIIYE